MDGSLRDQFVLGQRLGPASLSFAEKTFPAYILELIQNQLKIDAPQDVNGHWIVWLTSSGGARLVVLSHDFDLMREIAEEFGPNPRVYFGEPDFSVLERIKTHVQVKFGNRSPF